MIKLRITKKGQTTFPKALRELLGVQPGGDVIVELKNGIATLAAHRSSAGMLAQYAKPKSQRAPEHSVGKYLGELDAKTRHH